MDRWRGGRSVNKQLTEFKVKYYSIEEEYSIFNMELQFADTNPIVPVLKLILGILFAITSLLWIIQMYIFHYSVFLEISSKPIMTVH